MSGAATASGEDAAAKASAPAPVPLADHTDHLHAFSVTGLVGNLVGAVVVVALFRDRLPAPVAIGWSAVFAVALGLRAVMAWAYRRHWQSTPDALRDWRRFYLGGLMGTGALWGLAVWLFWPYGGHLQQTALLLTVYSYCLAAVPALATQMRLFLAFTALTFVPTVARIASMGTRESTELAGILTLIFLMSLSLGRSYQRAFHRMRSLKDQGQQLLSQLQAEKLAADGAKAEAERANRAKTQFFAAASHDLRQPLHALGLFAEALRHRVGADEEVAHLVNSINSSVDALEGLFSELLDITRIDTGGVEPHPESFGLDAMFARLKLHFEPVAFEKGLALHLRGGRHAGYADPLLVERILRNLLSNAIRYTHDGGVLVAARRRGDRLLLQVFDTGMGISEHEQERVFEEFYQVPDVAPALDPAQRKGLGLGLAIVRRLARVIDAPLVMRSVPGRGTAFTLTIPAGQRPRPAAAPAPRSRAIGLSLEQRFIVVVEDDPAVRGGLEVLLRSWGATVAVFESALACVQWADSIEAVSRRPDLLVVDYRLESGHTGVQVIDHLRGVFGNALPAVVVTGSLMSDQETLAAARGFHLLLKPVVPAKLRAMIAFKLGQR
jgi:signal transduction histidine kinase/CheY-like chemotaxis protein